MKNNNNNNNMRILDLKLDLMAGVIRTLAPPVGNIYVLYKIHHSNSLYSEMLKSHAS